MWKRLKVDAIEITLMNTNYHIKARVILNRGVTHVYHTRTSHPSNFHRFPFISLTSASLLSHPLGDRDSVSPFIKAYWDGLNGHPANHRCEVNPLVQAIGQCWQNRNLLVFCKYVRYFNVHGQKLDLFAKISNIIGLKGRKNGHVPLSNVIVKDNFAPFMHCLLCSKFNLLILLYLLTIYSKYWSPQLCVYMLHATLKETLFLISFFNILSTPRNIVHLIARDLFFWVCI